MASFILLIAMIGAIQLTLQKETPSKKQEAFEQNARDFTKTVVKNYSLKFVEKRSTPLAKGLQSSVAQWLERMAVNY